MSNRLVRVRRADVLACMTCPLCKKPLLDATTISVCLHTFCRKCIYEKLSDDECDTCPVCDINLGGDPVDKLRPDHNLQDIRAKIFPIKRKMADAPEAAPSVSLPAKRKERSLSSLVVSAPRVSVHAGTSGKKTRAVMRKCSALNGSSPSTDQSPTNEEDLVEDHVNRISSSETLNKIFQNKKPEDAGNSCADGKVDLWKPLNCLVKAANRTKLLKSNSAGPSHVNAKPDPNQDAFINATKPDLVENGQRREARDATNSLLSPVKRKRLRPTNRKTVSASGEPSSSPHLVVAGMRQHRQNVPIWFSLVASEDQAGDAPLPQISSGFLRIKNGGMPVSSIQKYVAKKLELASENEVQILCQGQAVHPSLELRGLFQMWLRNAPATRHVKTKVGSSGKDFVMVLTYARKKAEVGAPLERPPENNS